MEYQEGFFVFVLHSSGLMGVVRGWYLSIFMALPIHTETQTYVILYVLP